MENGVAREKRNCISTCDICMDGKFAWLPPFVGQGQSAAGHSDIHITEAVTLEEPASFQTGLEVLPAHALDWNFAIR